MQILIAESLITDERDLRLVEQQFVLYIRHMETYSAKNENSVLIYSRSCHSKPA